MTMSVKRGTNTFSSSPQDAGLKTDGSKDVSAEEFKKAYGDQNLGEVLNKAADKNYVDPSKKLRSVGNNQMDKDAFFKLMLAQMKHQDPANPMQSHEMAAQLAQFTSLEQLNNIHGVLENMNKSQQPSSNYQALALIGKTVSGDSSKLTRAVGDTKHEFSFDLQNDAAKGQMVVKDSTGTVVKKLELGAMKKGTNRVEWNGLTEEGLPGRPGEYKISIEAKSSTGTKVYAKTSFQGRITGLNYTPEGPILLVGKQSLKLSDVQKIEESGPEMSTPSMPLGATGASNGLPASMGSKGAMPPGLVQLPNGMFMRAPVAGAGAGAGAGVGAGAATDAQAAPANAAVAAAPAPTEQKVFLPLNAQTTPVQLVDAGASKAAAEQGVVGKQEEFIPPAEEGDAKLASNIQDVPMAQDLINKIQRETR